MFSCLQYTFVFRKKIISVVNQNFPSKSRMSIFTQNLNPITGRLEWVFHKEDYDFRQEIARSAYADMLHDDERNKKYYDGLRSCVNYLRHKGEEIHVLDIGTGTGLLSMMAVKCGVDSVTACEAFSPVAECATMLIEKNGFKDKIKLIGKRSTELSVGPNEDQLSRRANILITEVFDTELIGEGAIETFRHAKEHLLTLDALIVPSKATIYAQVVDSQWVRKWSKINSISTEDKELISIPKSISDCTGSATVWDIQLSQVSEDLFTKLSKPIEVFKFDWSGREIALKNDNTTRKQFIAENDGSCDAVFMWWDITMDVEEKIILSCAPFWAHPDSLHTTKDSHRLPWRDHWMQAVYFPPKSPNVKKGDCLELSSSHDEYSLWFDVHQTQMKAVQDASSKCHECSCGLHGLVSRSRSGQLGDECRVNLYRKVLLRCVNEESVALVLGDTCIWAIAIAKLGARHVYVKESSSISKRILEQFIESNGVEDKVTILPNDFENIDSSMFIDKINLVFSEPYFSSSLLPWNSILYSYILDSMKQFLSVNTVFLPAKMTIKALPVHYKDLWKIRAPLKECCGFTMENFDEMIDDASTEADANVEPQPLWEYPTYALSTKSHTLFEASLDTSIPSSVETSIPVPFFSSKNSLESDGSQKLGLNGVALWCDWEFGSSEDVLSVGPRKPIDLFEQIDWDPYTRQGVFLFNQDEIPEFSELNAVSNYDPSDGSFKFSFILCKK